MKKVIVYFTDSRLEEELDYAVRKQLLKAAGDIPIISVSQKPLDLGHNICVGFKPRCYLSLYEQLLTGIRATDKDSIIFTCEHDVFYNPEYFEFVPPLAHKIYFNKNRYYWSRNQKLFIYAHGNRALSQGVGYRAPFLHYAMDQVGRRKVNTVALNIGPFENFESKYPNIDIRHGGNFSWSWVYFNHELSRKETVEVGEIKYWGSAKNLQNITGYKDLQIDTPEILHERFNKEENFNPIETDLIRNDFAELFNSFKFNKGAEVGVKKGVFSEHLCKNMPGLRLKCIDPYLPGEDNWDKVEIWFHMAQKALMRYDARIIKKTSMHASAEDIAKWSLDFVYIDADHTFNEVMQDIIVWADRVRPGGIVSGHDYHYADVKTAVDAYTNIHGYELFITKKDGGYPNKMPSWFFAKGL